jgi:metal-dependent amidase/aminoacylase/carboxypeptidase family protein
LRGSVKFIFQPAEEMPPEGEDGGAEDDDPRGRAGEAGAPGDLRPARHLAPARRRDRLPRRPHHGQLRPLKITVQGRQTHGAAPWMGVDPIVTAAQVVLGLQTVVSRAT